MGWPPPLFEDRSTAEQIIGAIVIAMIFGLITGLALGWNGVAFWILAGPIAIAGGFVGGMEHLTPGDGFVRGAIGGLVFGSFTLLGLEILDTEPKAYLAEPQVGFAIATTVIGAVLGALGAAYRASLERRAGEPAA